MKKDDVKVLEKNNVLSAAAAKVVIARGSGRPKNYGQEALDLGDKITIADAPIMAGSFNNTGYLVAPCTGDRTSISLTTLLGTQKVEKFFFTDRDGYEQRIEDGITEDDVWRPKYTDEDEVLNHWKSDFVGKKLEVVGICVDSITYANPRTLVAFREITE